MWPPAITTATGRTLLHSLPMKGYTGGVATTRAPDATLATAGALDAFATWLVRASAGVGLSLGAAGALATLERSGPLRLSTLADREHVAQPTMTALVGRLERDGLAVRTPDPADGRAVRVGITDAGREVLRRRRADRAARLATLIARADAPDRAALAAAVPALTHLVRDGRAVPATPSEEPLP